MNIFSKIDLMHGIIGFFGILLIINALITIFSRKYYSLFTKAFFIEPASDNAREKLKKYVEKDEIAQRYILSLVAILMGLVAVAWMFGLNLTYW